MRAAKYLGRLIGEFFTFAWHNKAWWMVPVALVLLLIAFLVAGGTAAAPLIYTLF